MWKHWKDSIASHQVRILYILILLLILFIGWQQSLIADLQERVSNIESDQYDNQLNDIRWEAEKALEENEEQRKDIYHIMKHINDQGFRQQQLEWDFYGKGTPDDRK
jgi:uncharacterized membrane protein